MKKQLLFVFAALATLVASAQTKVEIDGIWYNLVSKAKQAEVTHEGEDILENKKYSGSINIPSTVTYNEVEYSVTSIGEWAFSGCNLTEINIPKGVTSIGSYAFYGCSLTEINIPESVWSFGEDAFSYCRNLTAITIPKSVTWITNNAFNSCINLTAITIPESVTLIGDNAFAGCSSLTTINIPESVDLIRPYAFYGCSCLTTINIPENSQLYSINEYAFSGCKNLTAITIPESVTSIGDNAFSGCKFAFDNFINNSTCSDSNNWGARLCDKEIDGVLIDNNIVVGCRTSVITAIIPEGVTNIGYSAFFDCSSLTSIILSESVTSIGDQAFYGCSSLTTITLPDGVTSIGYSAFSGCCSLTAITSKASTPPVTKFWTFSNVRKSIPVFVPEGSVEAYKTAEDWSEFTNIIGVEGFKCATPAIHYTDGKLLFACDTEGAEIKTRVVTENDSEYTGAELEFIPTHTFTTYATMAGFEDSDAVTLTLCWIPCTEEHESEETGILTIPSKPVLISARDGVLTLSGLAEGTEVTLYTTDGAKVAQQQSSAGEAQFTVSTNQIYLVHIGDKVVKIGM